MRPWLIPCAIALWVPASGCCSFARFFCGPDRTPWVSVDYTTPELAVRTLLEALRRDEPEIVYFSLSDAYRNRLGVDQATMALAWTKVREQNPGLHVAGYAEVPGAKRLDPDRALLQLTIEGNRVDIEVVRQGRWEVRYRTAKGVPLEPGEPLHSLGGHAELIEAESGNRSTLQLAPMTFRHGADGVDLDAIEFAGIVRDWRIDRLTLLRDG